MALDFQKSFKSRTSFGAIDFQERFRRKIGLGSDEDVSTLEGIRAFAEERGVPIPEKETRKEGLITKIGNFLSTGGFAVGGLISGKGITRGIKEKISPSEALGFTKLKPKTTIGKVAKFAASLGVDVLLDPTTYLTFGTGAGVKIATSSGAKVLTRKGTRLLGELAEKRAIGIQEILGRNGIVKPMQQIKSDLILKTKRSAQVTEKNFDELLKTEGVFDAGGIKIAGIGLVPGKTIMRPVRSIADSVVAGMNKTEAGAEFVKGIHNIRNSVGKLFQRDFGLPSNIKKFKQKMLDSLDDETNKIIVATGSLFKGTTKAHREEITRAIDSGTVKDLPNELKAIAFRVQEQFNRIGKIESSQGILNNTIKDYVTHLYKGNTDDINAKLAQFRNKNLSLGKSKFDKRRVVPTIEEAEKLGLKPELDAAKIFAIRSISSKKALLERQYLNRIKGMSERGEFLKEFGDTLVDYKFPKKPVFKEVKNIKTGKVEKIRSRSTVTGRVPLAIVNDLNKLGRKAIDDESTNFALRGFDAVQNIFKGLLTAPFFAFHGRNAISNVSQNFLDINVQALNPAKHNAVIGIIRKAKGSIKDVFGTEHKYSEILEQAQKNGIIVESFGELDITKNIDRQLTSVLKRISLNSFNPASSRFFPVSLGRKVGKTIENEARLVNYITNIERGHSFEEAAVRTKEFLFDYDNLSRAEKEFARRAIPFYTFTRKNLELQLKSFLKTPGLFSAQLKPVDVLQNSINSLTEDEKEVLPEWVKEKFNISVGRQGDEVKVLYGLGLPVEDAVRFLVPKDLPKELLSRSTFIPKFFIERALGVSSFTGERIEDMTPAYDIRSMDSTIGLPEWYKNLIDYKEITSSDGKVTPVANPDWLHIMRSLPSARLQSTIKNVDDDRKNSFEKMLDLFSGIKIQTFDLEREALRFDREQIEEIETRLIKANEMRRFEKAFIPKNQ